MLIFNKYKESSYLNLDDIFETSSTIKLNSFRVFSLFKHSKKLIRSLLLLHFYIYSLYPFCPVLFRGSARYHLKLDSLILVITNSDCYENYFRFN